MSFQSKFVKKGLFVLVLFLMILLTVSDIWAQQTIPKISIDVDTAKEPRDVAVTLEILLLMTVLTLAPAILILTTSFTRIIVTFHFLRQATGLRQMPPTQVLLGLALFLTFFVMNPVFNQSYNKGIKPYLSGDIEFEEASEKVIGPLRNFMLKQTREKDIKLLANIAKIDKPKNADDIATHILIPAFVISELRIAFQIGFLIYIPFLVIDLVVASVLMSMGMLMLPPILISLPFKIMLFVLIDGWYLVIGSVIKSFNM